MRGASRFVTVEKIDGRYWFVQNDRPFIARGVSVVSPEYDSRKPNGRRYNVLEKYNGDVSAWAGEAVQRLRDWKFNTVAAWSHEYLYENAPVYHTRVLSLGERGSSADDMRLMDVFSDAYARKIDEAARKCVAPHAGNPWLIGYFANNELPWYGARGWPTAPDISLLTRYMQLSSGSPSKRRVVEFLRERYNGDFEAFRLHWVTPAESFDGLLTSRDIKPLAPQAKALAAEWAGVVAERYFKLCAAAIRRYDPNHLFLGTRFAFRAQTPVLKACGKYADVVSMNLYMKTGYFCAEMCDAVAALTGKPILITEFSWAAEENSSGCPNTTGVDVWVETQQDRADAVARYITAALARPYIVGYDWFLYADISPDGRFDGEDCNYGLLDIHDQPYTTLLDVVTDINGRVEEIHRAGSNAWPEYDPEALVDFQPIKLRGLEARLAQPLLWADATCAPEIYGDRENGGWIEVEQTSVGTILHVQTGTGWGCGLVADPLTKTHPDGSVNAAGARAIIMHIEAMRAFRFSVSLNESGHGEPGGQAYTGYGHADGEAYTHMLIDGREGDNEYVFNLANLELNKHHGNQRGNMTIDTDGISQIGLFFPGNQGDIALRLKSLRLE